MALDIDGTLGDYYTHFTNFLCDYYSVRMDVNEYKGHETFKEWFEKKGIDEFEYRQAKLAYRQGGQKRTMPVFSWTEPLVRALRQSHGVELWIATARPYLRLDNIDPDTREWLRRNNIQYDGLLYGADKYERLVDTVGAERIVAVVDDQPDMIESAMDRGLRAIQIVNKHNLAAQTPRTGCEHVLGSHLQQYIAGMVEEWYSNHKTKTTV